MDFLNREPLPDEEKPLERYEHCLAPWAILFNDAAYKSREMMMSPDAPMGADEWAHLWNELDMAIADEQQRIAGHLRARGARV